MPARRYSGMQSNVSVAPSNMRRSRCLEARFTREYDAVLDHVPRFYPHSQIELMGQRSAADRSADRVSSSSVKNRGILNERVPFSALAFTCDELQNVASFKLASDLNY